MNQHSRSTQDPAAISPEQTIMFERAPLAVPLNLGEWLAPGLLANWVREAVSNLAPQELEGLSIARQDPKDRPAAILQALLFSYCTGRYDSAEIARACHTEPLLMDLCGGANQFPDELEHFRRKNRKLLERILGQLLARAVNEKFIHDGQLPPGLQHSLVGRAGDRLDAAHLMSACGDRGTEG